MSPAVSSPELSPLPSESDAAAAITAIARYYDLDFGGFDADLELYRNFARRGGSRVLDLGGGTGRIAVPLAQAGCDVVMVEANAAMRAAGQRRLQDAGLTPLAQDFRTLELNVRFDLVVCALSTFCHLQTRADQQRVLTVVARHLAPDGRAVFDLPALSAEDWEPGPRTPLLEWIRRDPRSGRTVMKFATVEAVPASQTQLVAYLYDEIRDDGSVERTAARFPLRHVFRYEMDGLLEAAGLLVDQCYGSYNLDPVEAGERLIVVARHAGRVEAAE
ncbi:MAG: class I SAM-dependent methyltransferase [Dehalococcoidia bacterium]